jgi:hypothetical protein
MMGGRRLRSLAGALVLATTLGGAAPARAEFLEDAGWGALTVFANLGYMPAKLMYAAFGGMTGGLAYALTAGDYQTAETIWDTSMGGTYALTPRMLQGEDPIAFAGGAGADASAPEAMAADAAVGADGLHEQQLGEARDVASHRHGGS